MKLKIKNRKRKIIYTLSFIIFCIIFLINFTYAQTANSKDIYEWVTEGRTLNFDTYYPADFNLSNMTLLWSFQFQSSTKGNKASSISNLEQILYGSGTINNKSYNAINSTNGSTIWTFNTETTTSIQPAIADNNIIYVTEDGSDGVISPILYALNKTTGNQIWNFSLDDINKGQTRLISPIVYNGQVFIHTTGPAYSYSINATDGSVIWNDTTGLANSSEGTFSFSNGVLFINTFYGVNAINSTDGSLIWNNNITSITHSTAIQTPLIKEGVVYVGDNNGGIYAINESNGSTIWNFSSGGAIYGTPAVSFDMLFIGSNNNKFYALNKTTGNQIWNTTYTSISILSNPVITQNKIIFFADGYLLTALNITDGSQLWNYTTNGQMDYSSPILVNNVVYFEDNLGWIYAVGNPLPLPKVSLINPINYFNTSNNQITFKCNVTDNNEILNLSLYINTIRNITITNLSSGITNLTLQKTLNFEEGIYNWTCKSTNNLNKITWANNNRTFNYTFLNITETALTGLLVLDLSQNYNIILFIIMIIIVFVLFFMKLEAVSGFILTILGIMVIVNGYNILMGLFLILIAVFLMTMKRGEN